MDNIFDYFREGLRFIHIVRDGRDVITSRQPKKPSKYYVSSERWINDVSAGLNYKDDDRLLMIKYENLVRNYSEIIKKKCEFIGVDFAQELNNY